MSTMSCSSNLSMYARSLPSLSVPPPRLLLQQRPPAASCAAYSYRPRRPSHVTSAVSTDEAPPANKEKKAASFVGDMERGTLAEESGRSDGELTSRWREIHGCNDWQGLLDPIDKTLRGELIRYGEFAQACYDSFDYDRYSRYAGSCRYPKESFFSDVGLAGVGYEVTRYLYATSHISFPSFGIRKHNPSDDRMWSETGTFIGFVAVSTDEETARIGRRDIAVAWRGTVTRLEWIADLTAFLKPLSQFGLPCRDPRVKVEEGFAELYTSKNPDCKYCKYSAREQVLAEVRKLVERYAGQGEEVSVTVTGHSLGSALAMINAFDIAETGANVSPSAGGAKAPVCVFSFSGPRVGNTKFRERFEGELGVKALRILNVHDTVPKVPGVFTEAVLPMPLLRAADALGLPSVYSHIGVELALDHSLSPFLKNTLDLANYHNLEAHLHLLDGFVGRAREFKLGGRDPALVNKAADFLRDEHMVPPGWRQDANKGMVRSEDGRWVLPHRPRHVEDHPDDTDVHLAQLGLVPAS
ncbi:phospholipase A1-Igamma1, chloroplastic-like [Triticum dicoccoides]|uniref:phospholipase A1-Igamma1, chloroplastic-like n=1 Tax=Triticum dicoccoides TaxID=85692 RepID=UPI00188FF097|nr:phospholipase A1-Igamma1, chloroplastic-like [Triticum dicoccoides]